MGIVVGVVAQGKMGAGVAKRLHENGAEVRTLLSGRSAASAERARAAGMIAVADESELVSGADFFLSILPPGEALALARRMVPALTTAARKPIYVDCNAVSPQTAQEIARVIESTGAAFVDGGIIGGPPRQGYSPAIYASGPAAEKTAALRDCGIDWRIIDGPNGAASGLKMSLCRNHQRHDRDRRGHAARRRAVRLRRGVDGRVVGKPARHAQAHSASSIPRMYDKAYRWVGEMEEISDFLGASPPSRDMYEAIARLYEDLAGAEGGIRKPRRRQCDQRRSIRF